MEDAGANEGASALTPPKRAGKEDVTPRGQLSDKPGSDLAARISSQSAALMAESSSGEDSASCLTAMDNLVDGERRTGGGNGGVDSEIGRERDGVEGEEEEEEEEEGSEAQAREQEDGRRTKPACHVAAAHAGRAAPTMDDQSPAQEEEEEDSTAVTTGQDEGARAGAGRGGGEGERSSSTMARGTGKDEHVISSRLHDVLESKIAQLETLLSEKSRGGAAGGGEVDEVSRQRSKALRRQGRDLKALMESTESSAEEKLKVLRAKYVEQVNETKQLDREMALLRRKCDLLRKEKDTLSAEATKGQAVKQKLESLCRELQRQNKLVMEDSRRVATEEQQRREELAGRFQSTIQEITVKLEEQGEERIRQIRENEALREKLTQFTQKYEIREEHFQHQLKTKALELQLLHAKLTQQNETTKQEEEKVKLLKEQITSMLKSEAELRGQLSTYGGKFEQFQETLTKSNEVFATFKLEMDKMSKTIRKLEKENSALKAKCGKSDVTIIQLLEERATQTKQMDTLRAQKERLESLCRSLQAELKIALAAANAAAAAAAAQQQQQQQQQEEKGKEEEEKEEEKKGKEEQEEEEKATKESAAVVLAEGPDRAEYEVGVRVYCRLAMTWSFPLLCFELKNVMGERGEEEEMGGGEAVEEEGGDEQKRGEMKFRLLDVADRAE
ncbi:hypothetical protein CBR_g15990 [Chara braunii]|uniref:Alpha-taxilin n=1 Tax=Chara braunii TaxID=69332 RepID=A0A388JSS2_CHABU|nr:hypothetical protein CBR_g15990 [Chara braunii]|eukprot:GBG60869.1 hypothetical protein CBR_g15990 [Chara braunii]